MMRLQDGCTPLHTAASNGSAAVSRLLLKKGASVDDKEEVSDYV